MTKINREVHPRADELLAIWQYWQKRAASGSLLGLSSSMHLIMQDVPPDFKAKKRYRPTIPEYYFNEIADHINFIIKHKLMKEKMLLAKALIVAKVWSVERRDAYIEKEGISKQAFYQRVYAARLWFSDEITSNSFFTPYL